MGSAASRARRVAPALARESDALEPLRAGHMISARAHLRGVQRERRSGAAGDQEELQKEMESILHACESPDAELNRRLFRRAFFSSNPCGLCYGGPGQAVSETTISSGCSTLAHTETLRTDLHPEDRNAICPKSMIEGRADPSCTKAASVPGLCDHPPLALPVFYDATEEELMNKIEREFA